MKKIGISLTFLFMVGGSAILSAHEVNGPAKTNVEVVSLTPEKENHDVNSQVAMLEGEAGHEEITPDYTYGEWLPERGSLYRPMIADPRKLGYSAGYRFYDDAISTHSVAISLGEILPLYRWEDLVIFDQRGDLQLGLMAATWVVFDFSSFDDFGQIINADYEAGLHLSYLANDEWSYRFRLYHMSSHLGDEFIQAHPQVTRLNPSFEAFDLFASYDLTDEIRFYGGLGYIFRSDSSFPLHPLYGDVGVELRLLGKEDTKHGLYRQPFFAMHFRHWEDRSWESDSTYLLGVEWAKLKGFKRRTRLYLEYHDGFSLEGQFSKDPTSYLSINIGIGY